MALREGKKRMENATQLKMVNVTQTVVESMVDEVIREEEMCTCPRCRLDVMAIALNALPPQYAVSEEGKTYQRFRLQDVPQSRIIVYQAILKAAQTVKQRPRHGDHRSLV